MWWLDFWMYIFNFLLRVLSFLVELFCLFDAINAKVGSWLIVFTTLLCKKIKEEILTDRLDFL